MITPTLHSRWTYRKNGVPTTVRVTGIWGIGAREKYRPISFDLEEVSGGDKVNVDADTMYSWIRENRIQWVYNEL